MKPSEEIVKSSGNVFADLGLPNPEERLAKAELARQIRKIVESRGLTQVEAGEILGLAQPNVSILLSGRLKGFSVERLLTFLTALDQNVEIVITPKTTEQAHGVIRVAAP
jgi:predicted XRE-type DNA-binding protein